MLTCKVCEYKEKLNYGNRQLNEACTVVKEKFGSVLNVVSEVTGVNKNEEHSQGLNILMDMVKANGPETNTQERSKLLTLVPDILTVKCIKKFFETSNAMVQKSKEVETHRGLLEDVPEKKQNCARVFL